VVDVVHGCECIQSTDRRVTINLLKQRVPIGARRRRPPLWVEVGPHRLP
jgi:hypothetical protein